MRVLGARHRSANITHALELQQFLTSKTEQLRVILADAQSPLDVRWSKAAAILDEMELRNTGTDPQLIAFIADTRGSVEEHLGRRGAV